MPTPSTRPHDLVLWGVTGFTGRLVAEYVLGTADGRGLRVALGGRSREKLEAARASLVESVGADPAMPLVLGDAGDAASMRAVTRQCRVVCSTVGPYAKYGSALVAAAAAEGTHYCDITGEVAWVRQMRDAHDAAARSTGARIVSFAGFDSIPSDLGVFMLHDYLAREHGGRLTSARNFVVDARGGVSGGTLDTFVTMSEAVAKDRSLLGVLTNPHALWPADAPPAPSLPEPMGVRYDRELGGFTAPFVMASINSRVVHWTNALLGYPYGPEFAYRETMGFPASPWGLARAAGTTAGLGALAAGLSVTPIRRLLARHVFPPPGEGPSREVREAGGFRLRILGEGVDGGGRPVKVEGTVVGHADPGYGETAKMLGETALTLALEDARLGDTRGLGSPAALLGRVLLERLRRAGMEFEAKLA